MNRPLAAIGLTAALLGGCAAVGPNYVPPQSAVPAGLVSPGESLPSTAAVGSALAADWWSVLGSPEIDAVVRQAIAGNPSLQASRERLNAARETLQAQKSRLQGDATASIAREHINLAGFGFTGFPGVTLENPTVNLYSVGAAVSYDFDLFGGERREREARAARVEAAAAELDAAQLTLTGQVVVQALTIASLKAQIADADALGRQDHALVDLAAKALEGGSGTRLDAAGAQAQLAADQATIPTLHQQLAEARHALALLVGKAPADWSEPDFDIERIAEPTALPVALPSELAHRRPDIRAAEARLHAATAQIGVDEARLYPSLTLSGNLSQTSLEPGKIFSSDFSGWSAGPLGFRLPILGRAQLKAQSRAAEAESRAAAEDYRRTVLQAFGQVADALQSITNDQAVMGAQTRALATAQESLRLNRLRYEGGKSGLQPVLDAQRAYHRVRVSYLRARTDQYLAATRLFLATGGGWTGGAAAASTKG